MEVIIYVPIHHKRLLVLHNSQAIWACLMDHFIVIRYVINQLFIGVVI